MKALRANPGRSSARISCLRLRIAGFRASGFDFEGTMRGERLAQTVQPETQAIKT